MFLLFESIANLLNARKDLLGQMLDTISKERVFERCGMASNQEGKPEENECGPKMVVALMVDFTETYVVCW